MEAEGKAPSLLELCVRKAIDNLRRIESVDGVDTPLLPLREKYFLPCLSTFAVC
jgi:hypothetical protein